MLLKRHYDDGELSAWLKARDAEVSTKVAGAVKALGITEQAATKLLNDKYADEHPLPKITHVEVKRCGARQRLNQGFIDNGVAQGWLSLGDGKITIKTDADPLVFRIVRPPGYYSCYDGSKLPGVAEAKAHVAQQKKKCPDRENPAGYRQQLFYECVREQANG